MGNDIRGAIKKLKLLTYNSKSEAESFRRKIDDAFSTAFLPNRVECSEITYGGVVCDVLSPEIYASNRIMLYVHGGSFVGGSRAAYRAFCSSLAFKSCSRVVVPEYRLSPTSPYPAPVEDIQSVFRNLWTEEQVNMSISGDGELREPEIIVAADGSAAGIALALIFNLREKYRKCIKNVVLFSPWLSLDISDYAKSPMRKKDKIISEEILKKSAASYTYYENLKCPFVSPVFASDEQLKDFPPVFIQMGENEILLEVAKKFAERLRSLGNEVTLDVWPDMVFMFQMADEFFHESHLAMDKVGFELTKERNIDSGKIENLPKLEDSLKSEA